MTFDGKTVRLFVDGKLVAGADGEAAQGRKPEPRPADHRPGASTATSTARLRRPDRRRAHFEHGPHDRGVPGGRCRSTLTTVGAVAIRPRRRVLASTRPGRRGPYGHGEPWERETDKDWIDGRFQKMDTGPS